VSSYAIATVVPVNNATEAASFLEGVIAAEMEEAGWTLWRVLMDGGSELKVEFDNVGREINMRHTRTRPRHAWTNGFVERTKVDPLSDDERVVHSDTSIPTERTPIVPHRGPFTQPPEAPAGARHRLEEHRVQREERREHKGDHRHQLDQDVERRSHRVLQRVADCIASDAGGVGFGVLAAEVTFLDVFLRVVHRSARVGAVDGQLDRGEQRTDQETAAVSCYLSPRSCLPTTSQ